MLLIEVVGIRSELSVARYIPPPDWGMCSLCYHNLALSSGIVQPEDGCVASPVFHLLYFQEILLGWSSRAAYGWFLS